MNAPPEKDRAPRQETERRAETTEASDTGNVRRRGTRVRRRREEQIYEATHHGELGDITLRSYLRSNGTVRFVREVPRLDDPSISSRFVFFMTVDNLEGIHDALTKVRR